MAALYHLGIMQVVVYALGRCLGKILGVSGAESMSVVADVFVGMTEAPLVVRPYIEKMTPSELMTLMTGGFATIAGTVLGAYMSFVGDRYAGHLITASFMAAPASIVIAKMLLPETGEPETGRGIRLVIERPARNLLDAIAMGVRDGLHLALNIAAMLIAFYSLIALVNWPLESWLGTSIQELLGHALSPLAWCLGADWKDSVNLGSLLGTKIVTNEWIAYQDLQRMIQDGAMSDHAIKIATFSLCGFANFGSIGVILGGVGHLAPSRRGDLARLALLAMTGGALASCLTGAIAGMFA
jgi:CNT family concentrative nucleoside transporter